jgi:tetratricopeptide (TPR) repeat protein
MLRCFAALWLIGSVVVLTGGCGGSSDSQRQGISYKQQIQNALREPAVDVRARELIGIAAGQAKASDRSGAKETMRLATQACREISDPMEQADTWLRVAEAQADFGNRSEARKAIKAAADVIDGIENAAKKGALLAAMAQVMAKANDQAAATRTLGEAEQLAGQIEGAAPQATALCQVARAYQRIGQADEAKRVVEDLLQLAGTIEDARNRCDVLVEIATEQHEMKMTQPSAKTFDLAIEAAGAIEASDAIGAAYGQSYAFCEIAKKLSTAGNHAKAQKLLDKAEKLVPSIANLDLQEQMKQNVRKLKRELPDG